MTRPSNVLGHVKSPRFHFSAPSQLPAQLFCTVFQQWHCANQLQSSYGLSGLYRHLERRFLFHVQRILNYVMHNFNTKFRFQLNTLQNIHVSTFLKDPKFGSRSISLIPCVPRQAMTSWCTHFQTVGLTILYTPQIKFWVQAAVSSQLKYTHSSSLQMLKS